MKELNATVGVFDTHDTAVKAVKEVNKAREILEGTNARDVNVHI